MPGSKLPNPPAGRTALARVISHPGCAVGSWVSPSPSVGFFFMYRSRARNLAPDPNLVSPTNQDRTFRHDQFLHRWPVGRNSRRSLRLVRWQVDFEALPDRCVESDIKTGRWCLSKNLFFLLDCLWKQCRLLQFLPFLGRCPIAIGRILII